MASSASSCNASAGTQVYTDDAAKCCIGENMDVLCEPDGAASDGKVFNDSRSLESAAEKFDDFNP